MHHDPLNDPLKDSLNDPLGRELSSSSDRLDQLDPLDQRLTRALEAAPTPQIPADFAARITASLPPRRSAPASPRLAISIPTTHYGRSAMLLGIVVIFAAMATFAVHTVSRSLFEFAIEWTLFAQFVALTVWFSAFRHRTS